MLEGPSALWRYLTTINFQRERGDANRKVGLQQGRLAYKTSKGKSSL
jgi:hypothetical protein